VDDRVLRFVGLALRARRVAVGRDACKRAARNGVLHAIVVAADAGPSAARDAGAGPGVPVVPVQIDKRELGSRVGKTTLAVLGITDAELAAGIIGDTARGATGKQRRR
jgi:ribosomal protein L7Ae-like RNA K-turn-binding protein